MPISSSLADRFNRPTRKLLLSSVLLVALATQPGAQEIPAQLEISDDRARRTFEVLPSRQSGGGIFLFEKGVRRTEASRRRMTSRVLVHLQPEIDPQELAVQLGARADDELPYAPRHYIFHSPTPRDAWRLTEELRVTPGVLSADPLLARKRNLRFTPNDPLFPSQWHLRNEGQRGGTPGADINVSAAWDAYRGRGVDIAIVDDGLLQSHPDLAGNIDTTLGTDLIDWDSDPSPEGGPGPDDYGEPLADSHGTAVAGILGALGGNSLGGAGVAFESTLIGVRVIGGDSADDEEAEALSYLPGVVDISNNSWGSEDDGETLGGAGKLVRMALESGATTGRSGLGTIYVFAAGNGGEWEDNANYDTYANSIYTIAVGATNDRGERASYSEPGACLMVSAPGGNDAYRFQGISTTDLVGEFGYNHSDAGSPAFPEFDDRDYTQNFSGTSAATPIVSGVAALMLEANPNLGWRDVQEILMRGATKAMPDDSKWFTNSAGFAFNPDFGAGLVNATAAVGLAARWNNLPAQEKIVLDRPNLNIPIPLDDPSGIAVEFVIDPIQFRAEHVTLDLDVLIQPRGNLAITLTSPTGITSTLAEPHADPNPDYYKYTFMSLLNWGENPSGAWTLRVSYDEILPPRGPAPTLLNARLNVHGTIASAPPTILAGSWHNAEFILTASGTAGQDYELQSTQDFTAWHSITTVSAPAAEFELIDPAPESRRRFYRVVPR